MAEVSSSFFPNSPQLPRSVAASQFHVQKPAWDIRTVAGMEDAPLTAEVCSGAFSATGAPSSAHLSERLCFPGVRSSLWDRTPRGNRVLLQPVTPRLALLPRLIPQLSLHASQGEGAPAILHAQTRSSSSGSDSDHDGFAPSSTAAAVSAATVMTGSRAMPFVEISAHTLTRGAGGTWPAHEPLLHNHALPVGCQPCNITTSTASWPGHDDLAMPVATYTSLVRRADAAVGGAAALSLGELIPMHCAASTSPDGSALLVRAEAAVPTLTLEATPLYALSVVPSPLADVLREPSSRGALRTGYLTMDQTRRLTLLAESDPKAFEAPLVGVWVSGVASLEEPYVWAAAVRFARLREGSAETVTASDGSNAFLLLLYADDEAEGLQPGGLSVSPRLFDLTPSPSGVPYRLVGRALQLTLPVPSHLDAPIRLELYTCQRPEFSESVRSLSPYPLERRAEAATRLPTARPPPGLPMPSPPLSIAAMASASASVAIAAAEDAAMAIEAKAAAARATAAASVDEGGDGRHSAPSDNTSASAAVAASFAKPPSRNASDRAASRAEATAVLAARTDSAGVSRVSGCGREASAAAGEVVGAEGEGVEVSSSLLAELQAQMATMARRLEMQQRTIERLTAELSDARAAAASSRSPKAAEAAATTAAEHSSSAGAAGGPMLDVGRGAYSLRRGGEGRSSAFDLAASARVRKDIAMRAAMLAATAEERALAGRSWIHHARRLAINPFTPSAPLALSPSLTLSPSVPSHRRLWRAESIQRLGGGPRTRHRGGRPGAHHPYPRWWSCACRWPNGAAECRRRRARGL